MEFLDNRIRIDEVRRAAVPAPLVSGLVGHCPGRINVQVLQRNRVLLGELERAGFSRTADRLERGAALRPEELYFLPIPISSGDELDSVFPNARTGLAQLAETADALRAEAGAGAAEAFFPAPLADGDDVRPLRSDAAGGTRAWLPWAADDFFAGGGERLWIVRVPEPRSEPLGPHDPRDLEDALDLRQAIRHGGGKTLRRDLSPGLLVHRLGLLALLRIPQIGVVALPDLERLLLPDGAEPEPLEPVRPVPVFMPCGSGQRGQVPAADGGHPGAGAGALDFPEAMQMLAGTLEAVRPDVQCLLTLPMERAPGGRVSAAGPGPAIDPRALAAVADMAGDTTAGTLRRLQLLWPYLRNESRGIHSPTGPVAAGQVRQAKALGVWRSIAGTPLGSRAVTYPRLSRAQLRTLREEPGIGLLTDRRGQLVLDDERLAVPALHPGAYDIADIKRWSGYRSGEVRRFIGFLLRELAALGDTLVFTADDRDPRPRILLEAFFNGLHGRGALRGRQPRDAFTIRKSDRREGVIAYDIDVAPAVPIDKLILSFVNRAGRWQAGVADG